MECNIIQLIQVHIQYKMNYSAALEYKKQDMDMDMDVKDITFKQMCMHV